MPYKLKGKRMRAHKKRMQEKNRVRKTEYRKPVIIEKKSE